MAANRILIIFASETNTEQSYAIISTVLLVLMTATFITCGVVVQRLATIRARYKHCSAGYQHSLRLPSSSAPGLARPLSMPHCSSLSTSSSPCSARWPSSSTPWRSYTPLSAVPRYMRCCLFPYSYWPSPACVEVSNTHQYTLMPTCGYTSESSMYGSASLPSSSCSSTPSRSSLCATTGDAVVPTAALFCVMPWSNFN